MHICMVAHHGCIRVFKEALALLQRGHTVDVIAKQAPFGFNRFSSLSVYHDEEQLRRTVAASPADVFHVHNEPDWLVRVTREGTDRPIVYDIHDLESMRWQAQPDDDELAAFAAADALVHVSEPCREAAERYHGKRKPNIVLPPYVNEEFVGPDPAGDVSWTSIVYQGGLATGELTDRGPDGQTFNMRYYGRVVSAFAEQGFNVHLYGAGDGADGFHYENLGGIVHNALIYPVLMRALRSNGFGLVGAERSYPLMEAAMPNKLFEYMSQGVVPVCLNAAEAARFCEEHGVGIRVDTLDNLHEQLADGPAYRERILAQRREWTMEKHIGALEALYQEIV